MAIDAMLIKIALMQDGSNGVLLVNDQNAAALGLNMEEIRNEFSEKSGKRILTNESVQIRFNSEGQHLDFSTFDGVSMRVPFEMQFVAPNKGWDGTVQD